MKKPYRIINPGYSHQAKQFIRAHGNYLYDSDDRPFIDMVMGAGSLILGHSHNAVVEKIKRQSEKSSLFLQNNPNVQALSNKVSQLIPSELTNHIYCNTGSEATQRAIRLARAATGKTHIASFQGGWHGMNEWTLLDDGGRFGQSIVRADNGIPSVALEYSLLLPYNDDAVWEIIDDNATNLAAIIIEPIQGSNPQPNISPFLSKLTEYCRKLGILVIYDEIITGFRVAPGGAADLMDLKPDIVTYGKVLGGGLPLGLVAFNNQVFVNTFADKSKQILTGGTFSANPISAAAGLATLDQLTPQTYTKIKHLTDFFLTKLNQAFQEHKIKFNADGSGSINRIYFTDQKIKNRKQRDSFEISAEKQTSFRTVMLQQGVLWPTNGIICMPASQNEKLLTEVIEKIIYAAKAIEA
ncbi:aminotransferase class III-fold pyridoxal phosphate-dependent enzyme [Aliiglaciecola sp. SL4]|uniref:aminotransferase class III-fold pyridoxal phosphate-dependent enzyme n=1 Tax=Aliiglaciecola sp. SL4 TaxID=3239806 RepID=UPI00355C138C